MLGRTGVFYNATFLLHVSTKPDSEWKAWPYFSRAGFPLVQLLEIKDNIQWAYVQGQETILDCNTITVFYEWTQSNYLKKNLSQSITKCFHHIQRLTLHISRGDENLKAPALRPTALQVKAWEFRIPVWNSEKWGHLCCM